MDSSIIDFALETWPDLKKGYARGSILFWQDDPVEQIFVILKGAVKISSISSEGKIYSFGIMGAGRLIGARSYLLDGIHNSVAEVLDDTEVLVIPPSKFDQVLITNQGFSSLVMKELARQANDVADKARALSFLDVQQRLLHSLIGLAQDHGIRTEKGIMIDLNITQDEIGAMVSANRTTIASCLSELRAKGFLWKEGRRLVIIPPEHIKILDALGQAVEYGADQDAEKWANQAIEQGIDPYTALEALTEGMKRVDREYSRDEAYLPSVVAAASAMKRALPVIESNIELDHSQEIVVGTVVIGTVMGDIHDIGKMIVAMLLRARNFRVIDLGVDISPSQFADAVAQFKPDILALAASTTMTLRSIKPVIDMLSARRLRSSVKVIVGGSAVTEAYAETIGADGYNATAQGTVEMAWRLCTWDNPSLD